MAHRSDIVLGAAERLQTTSNGHSLTGVYPSDALA